MRLVRLYVCVNLFLPFQHFSVPDVWKLDVRNARVHRPRVHRHVKGMSVVVKIVIETCYDFSGC